jgi:hypothetical protein
MMPASPHSFRSLNTRRVWWCVLAVLVISPAHAQRLTLKRDLVIGAVEAAPELEFQNIGAIAVHNDGTLYIADGGSRTIRVFDRNGKFIRKWGRRGNGPGEFSFVSALLLHGDTVFTIDRQLQRVTTFTREGAVLATWRTGPRNLNQANPLAPVPTGWWIHASTTPPELLKDPKAGEVRQLTARFGISPKLDIGPDSLRTIVSYESQRWIGYLAEGRMAQANPLFEPVPDNAADHRGLLYVSRGSPYRIDVYDVTGKLVRSLARRHDPVPVTSVMINRYRTMAGRYYDTISAANMIQPQFRKEARAQSVGRADLPTPATIPPLGDLFVSAGGVVWVLRIDQYAQPVDTYFDRSSRQPRNWDVFDEGGAFIGTAQTPAKFTLRAVTEREIVGVERDELDVQYVVRYRFR